MRRAAAVTAMLIGLVTAGCVPTPPGPTTTTSTTSTTTAAPPWLPAGCYANNLAQWVLGSIEFSGVENQLHNALQHFTTDGACSDGSPAVVTIVRAANATSAVDLCNSLGGPDTFTSVTNLSSSGWVVPADAWFCQTPLFP